MTEDFNYKLLVRLVLNRLSYAVHKALLSKKTSSRFIFLNCGEVSLTIRFSKFMSGSTIFLKGSGDSYITNNPSPEIDATPILSSIILSNQVESESSILP